MTTASAPNEIKLQPCRLDFNSVRTQMIAGLILISISCVVCYWRSCSAGFLLDDFYHVDYVSRAFQGHWHDFLREFYSNWTGTDILTSYRPAISVSYFIDYLLWGIHSAGYHISNILMFFGCCSFVALITLEITGLYGNRLGAIPAIWAGLLFSVYPLHPEAVAWIIGRVDVQCGLFYLASVWTYLRFRLLREKAYLWASIIFFMIALPSKEMAVTLPVVLTLAEIFLFFKREQMNESPARQVKYAGIFWLLLAAYAIFRTLLLGTMVGGYGGSGLFAILKLWKAFIDKSSLLKLVFPLSEEVSLPFSQFKILGSAYVLVMAGFLYRLISRSVYLRPFLFLLSWIIIAVLPTFQIWHIYPNLVGSRLFFLSSVPFCIMLVLIALPAIDAISKIKARSIAAIGCIALFVILVFWAIILEANLKPWQEAGAQMNRLRSDVLKIAKQTPEGKRTLFLNLPQDHSGAGMLGRPQFLETLVRPPFATEDLSSRVLTIEPQLAGSREYIWANQFQQMFNNHNLYAVYIWQPRLGQFINWSNYSAQKVQQGTQQGIQKSYSFSFNSDAKILVESQNATVAKSSDWYQTELGKPQIITFPDHIHVIPGSSGVTIYVPLPANLDSLKANLAKVYFYQDQLRAASLGKIQLVWDSLNSSETQQATFFDNVLPIGRYRSWSLNGPVKKLGLRFLPGLYAIDVSKLEITADSNVLPMMKVTTEQRLSKQDPRNQWLITINMHDHPYLIFDVTSITGAESVDLIATKSGVTFDPSSEYDLLNPYAPGDPKGDKLLLDCVINQKSGSVALPKKLLESGGLHQIRIIAQDKSGKFVGIPSEPQSIFIGNQQ